jgi:hypothetical protein
LKIKVSPFLILYGELSLARYTRFRRAQKPPILGWFHAHFLPCNITLGTSPENATFQT